MLKRFFTTDNSDQQMVQQRRDFLKMGLVGVASAAVPSLLTRDVLASSKNEAWKISFRHAHTGESFSGVYRVGDKYLPEAFERLNYVMRDFRTEEVFPMDPHVVDIMSIIHSRLRAKDPYQILSGYRSPKTNAMLKRNTRGVASNSFHMYGQAVDIRLLNESTREIRNIAKSLQAGGVGYYPRSNFVHVDTGQVRSWTS
ncbi:MAG: YcbK family protein [Alphaproteobacteria bacterium]